MKRYLYAFDSCAAAQHAFDQFRKRGMRDEDISIISGEARVWKRFPNSIAVLIPRSGRGAGTGGLAGLCVGLFALTLLRVDPSVAAFMLLLFTASAAILGAWISTPIDAIDNVSQTLEEEVECGGTLLVVASNLRNHAMLATKFAPETDAHLLWRRVTHSNRPNRSESASKVA